MIAMCNHNRAAASGWYGKYCGEHLHASAREAKICVTRSALRTGMMLAVLVGSIDIGMALLASRDR